MEVIIYYYKTGFLSVGEKLHNSNSESARDHGLVNKVEYWNDDIKTINKGGKLEVGDTILAKWKPSNEGHASPDSRWYTAQIIDFVYDNYVRVCWQNTNFPIQILKITKIYYMHLI